MVACRVVSQANTLVLMFSYRLNKCAESIFFLIKHLQS